MYGRKISPWSLVICDYDTCSVMVRSSYDSAWSMNWKGVFKEMRGIVIGYKIFPNVTFYHGRVSLIHLKLHIPSVSYFTRQDRRQTAVGLQLEA